MIGADRIPQPVEVSVAIYRNLLAAYPTGFRERYGTLMVQVFRDECLKAFQRYGSPGLAQFWAFNLIDLARTSIEERLIGDKRRRAMSEFEPRKPKPVTRREFLNAAWMASLGFLLVDLGGLTYLYTMPILKQGKFGGSFGLGRAGDAFPEPGAEPVNNPNGRFWLARTENNQIVAPYKVCVHLGCLYNWNSPAGIFMCPCHLSQYELDGTYIKGPATRSLDRFVIRLIDDQGREVAATDAQGNPLPLPSEDLQVVVETGQLIRGKPKGESYPIHQS
jgi:cytochrome b6-f complex iron-sulfur subunit